MRVPTPRRAAALVLGLVLAATAAACSGDDGTADTVNTEAASTTVRTTAPRPTTTTEAVTTTTEAPIPTAPLTGLPVLDPATLSRPALVVKIDNHPEARPQSGLNAADIIFEENVEQLTRFALVFQAGGADPVGPIRSGRTQDIDLLGSFNGPLFAWSGGNGRVTAAIRASDLQDVGAPNSSGPGGYFRSSDRRAPHNLYAQTSKLYTLARAGSTAPQPQFTYRDLDEPSTQGEPASGVKLRMDGVRVQWLWNADLQAYQRWQDDKVHSDANDGQQVNSANVVVLFVNYRPSPADARSPEAITTGYGEAWVFTDGRWVNGSWLRATRTDPFTLQDANGEVIALTPGRTWVELSKPGKAAVIPAGADPASVPYP